MTPVLIVALPDGQSPIVWWASDRYIVAAVARLDEGTDMPFDEACQRYSDLHGEAHFFVSQAAALAWAETYTGAKWLELRAEIARAPETAPHDLALTE